MASNTRKSPSAANGAASQEAVPDELGFRVVHHSVPRKDGPQKVTGRATYTADVHIPRMTYAKVLRSELAHARIVSIDTSAALQRPGVVAVVTGQDLMSLNMRNYGHAVKDHPVLAYDKVRYIGEPVAAVVAEDETTAQEALADIVVEYEELSAVITVEEALAEGAPLVHEQGYDQGVSPGHVDVDTSNKRSNVCQENHVRWGDVDAAFARAARVIKGDYTYPMTFAYPMEPYVSIADYTEEGLTMYSAAQHLYMVRNDVAGVFGLPLNRVRMITPFIGGGYGAKSYTKIEPLTAVCSWKARRPVRLQLTVEESILTTRADDSKVHIETAVDENGKLLARRAMIYLNTGAFAENSPLVSSKTAIRIIGPYLYDAVDITSYAIYTNTCPASSYRGFGISQIGLPAEGQMNELAAMLGEDSLQFRLKNLADSGQRFFPKKRPLTADVKGDIIKATEALGWNDPLPPNRGRGLGVLVTDAGAVPVGRSEVRVYGDGSVTVFSGSTEMGQGSMTVLAQIAAEEFGTSMGNVRVMQSDTALVPFARSTGADRTTTLEGRTVLQACVEAKEQIRVMAADIWEAAPEDIVLEPTGVMSEGRRMGWGEVIGKYFDLSDMEVTGRAHIRQKDEFAELPPWWEPAIAAVEVEVNPDTGKVTVHKLVTVADIGLAINPATSEGQDLGSATMGIGVALGEELVYDGQQLSNGSILDYRIPRFSDVPANSHGILVENQDGIGPYGAKGIGDGPTSVICAAVANGIYQATGVWLHDAPFTPERVWRAIREQRAAQAQG
ncbi:MAG: xanthine dehydrogenase family protein molybdopterin-binding subunit [Chloroflexi bacterium]|nr:xanthine dehydrogenase family protein molybdopterin-binding subunit [Chloroflexota bacterium]